MSMLDELLRDFRAEGEAEAAILRRLREFLARYGEAALSAEIAGEAPREAGRKAEHEIEGQGGHITASAAIFDGNARLLLIFGRKEARWKLPETHGEAHGETHGEMEGAGRGETWRQLACFCAAQALGCAPQSRNSQLWALGEREVEAYWNTPAHRHFELIFRFDEPQIETLPRGARWFSLAEIEFLRDATLERVMKKSK